MPDGRMTEAEAVERFSRDLEEIAAQGRAPDCAERLAAIVAENERECAAQIADERRRLRERADLGR